MTPTLELTKLHPLFHRVHWVTRATSSTPDRPELTRLFVQPNLIQATDRHRVHTSRAPHDLEPGLYKIHTRTKARVEIQLDPGPPLIVPDTASIWPDSGVTVMLSGCTIPVALARIIRALPENYSIDHLLVDDMLRDQKFFAADVGANGVTFTNTAGDQSGLIATIVPYKVGE